MIQSILKKAWRFLTRMNVAAVLIVMVLLLTALGSCFPQLSVPFTADAERLASWEMEVRTRYGGAADVLAALGVFRWFRSPIFIIFLTLLATATLVCTLDRWKAIWRRTFHHPIRCSDVTFESAPHTARINGFTADNQAHLLRERLRERGFHVQSESTRGVVHLRGDRNRLALVATLVTHLAVLLLLLGAILSRASGWQETLAIEPKATAEVGNGSGLALRNDGFVIARYPDGNVANYEAEVTVLEAGQAVMRRRVRVNEPLTYGGVGFYLHGYEETGAYHNVTLLAVRDPGYGLVIVAGFLLLFGLTVSFNFPHCWIHARLGLDGTLRLAGRAERRDCDFGREFTTLMAELKHLARVREGEDGGEDH